MLLVNLAVTSVKLEPDGKRAIDFQNRTPHLVAAEVCYIRCCLWLPCLSEEEDVITMTLIGKIFQGDRYNRDFYSFQGLLKRSMRPGRKQRDLGKEMGKNSPLSIKDMLAKL